MSIVYNGQMSIDVAVCCGPCRDGGDPHPKTLAEIRQDMPVRVFKMTRMSQREQKRYNDTFYALTANPGLLYPSRMVHGAQLISSNGTWHMRAVHAGLHRISDPHYLDAMPLKCKNGHELVLHYAVAAAMLERCRESGKTEMYLRQKLMADEHVSLCEITPE